MRPLLGQQLRREASFQVAQGQLALPLLLLPPRPARPLPRLLIFFPHLQIPGLVAGGDPRHFDLAAAQAAAQAGGGDFLVLRLQLLVDMGFKMASGQLEVRAPRPLEGACAC